MKLTILTQYYPPEIGAPQARLSELAEHFVRRGHDVTVLTAMPNYPTGKLHSGYNGFLKREHREGVRIIRTFIYPAQSPGRIKRLTSYFSFVISASVIGTLLLDRSDYLLVESPPLFLGLAGLWLSRIKKTRLIFNVSDLWPESAVRLGVLDKGGWAFRTSERLERLCYQRAWLITGQSKTIISNIRSRFPSCATFHLSNGVDTKRFCPSEDDESARPSLNPASDCVALYAGLHGLAQGLDQVLNAARALKEEGGFRFVLLGDGPKKRELQEGAKRLGLTNVLFLDPCSSAEIPGYLSASDILLVTLATDIPGAVPSKLYEAMACSRPVILVGRGEAADIVREHQAGITVAPGDMEGLTAALRQLRTASQLRRVFGENGRRAAIVHYDRTKIVSRFAEHLENHL